MWRRHGKVNGGPPTTVLGLDPTTFMLLAVGAPIAVVSYSMYRRSRRPTAKQTEASLTHRSGGKEKAEPSRVKERNKSKTEPQPVPTTEGQVVTEKADKQFCISCGKRLPTGSKFCNKCGTEQP